MGMLAASVAHEINNPLSFVLHNLESLGRELPRLFGRLQSCCENAQRHLDEEALVRVMGPEAERVQSSDFAEQQEMLQDALLGTRRIRELTHSLGSFSRVEHTELQALDVNHAVQHAISMAYNEIRYRARLVTQLNAVPLILASEGKIAQVILNLLINAAHAIVEGQIHQNQIRIRSWVERQLVHVEISDTGHGIKAEHQARIFDPFFTTKESGQGSGLGLAICKSIVDNFGGEISFESEWGRGTVFWLRFPIQGDRPASRPRIPILPDVVEEGRRGRLLVVEDEALLQKTLRRILGAEHEVVCASSGEEAQQLLEADTAFDMVLCDLMMPQMSGMELHAWLLQEAPELVNRMVFMTGGAFTSEASAFLDQVPNLRLEKPFEQDTVVKLVRKILAAG
ncbi:MAG: ATP-binding protein [Myxococcota bacterium]|nr:ATP-binding protein [Myxococcota bacterium]